MQSDYGILPMPKYEESQEGYSSYMHVGHASCMAIPMTCTNTEFIGQVLEDMAFYSYKTLRHEFYETTVTLKSSRDAESYDMLTDYIYQNIVVDLAIVMSDSGLGIDSSLRSMLINAKTNLASMFASMGGGYSKIITRLSENVTQEGNKQTGS
jgi:hypothetical protein